MSVRLLLLGPAGTELRLAGAMARDDGAHVLFADTNDLALELARGARADLILADVNLGHGGDGINAVRRIMASVKVPVIFVTAYPERLLTAEEVEPAFIMSKPFDPLTLAISTYQAVTAGQMPLE